MEIQYGFLSCNRRCLPADETERDIATSFAVSLGVYLKTAKNAAAKAARVLPDESWRPRSGL
jgi:hypothetical protein